VIHQSVRAVLLASAMLLLANAAAARDYAPLISEDYLRSQFTFGAADVLKYAECKKGSYPTCNYVWGEPSKKKDANAAKYGLAPNGKKLMLVYAQAKSAKDFERATSVYRDAESVAGIGQQVVWSAKSEQLTLMTAEHLIIHVNTHATEAADPKAKAIIIAKHVLAGL